jgi:hypothetical protein
MMQYKIKIQKLEYKLTYNTYEKVGNKVYWNYEATKGIISVAMKGISSIKEMKIINHGIYLPYNIKRNGFILS